LVAKLKNYFETAPHFIQSSHNLYLLITFTPRARSCFGQFGIGISIAIPDVDETYPDDMPVRMGPAYLSEKKANAAA